MSNDPHKASRARNLAYAAVAGQAGFSTVVLVIAALLLGLWVDSLFGLRGPFTIVFVVLSVPVSLLVMLRIVLAATRAIQAPAQGETGPAETAMKEGYH